MTIDWATPAWLESAQVPMAQLRANYPLLKDAVPSFSAEQILRCAEWMRALGAVPVASELAQRAAKRIDGVDFGPARLRLLQTRILAAFPLAPKPNTTAGSPLFEDAAVVLAGTELTAERYAAGRRMLHCSVGSVYEAEVVFDSLYFTGAMALGLNKPEEAQTALLAAEALAMRWSSPADAARTLPMQLQAAARFGDAPAQVSIARRAHALPEPMAGGLSHVLAARILSAHELSDGHVSVAVDHLNDGIKRAFTVGDTSSYAALVGLKASLYEGVGSPYEALRTLVLGRNVLKRLKDPSAADQLHKLAESIRERVGEDKWTEMMIRLQQHVSKTTQ